MKIMTFNMKNDGINPFGHWKQRVIGFKELIKKEKPDIIGTQEMNIKAKILLDNLLKENNLYYTFYGDSRKRDNSLYDEYNCILVKDSIKVIDFSTYSLSNTPHIPKSKFKDDVFPRIITHIETDKYHIYNTHLSAKILKNKLLQLECITSLLKWNKPVILLGDFNLGMKRLSPFMRKNGLTDATEEVGNTFSTKKDLFHLDHILIDNRLKYDNSVKILFKYNGRYLSDHFPIITEIEKI